MMDRETLLRRALKVFGIEAQKMMMIEEMSELAKALCKLDRAGTADELRCAKSAILGEIADVQIMLDQMKLAFGNCGDYEIGKLEYLEGLLDEREGLRHDI